jgi:hypothetical protein
VPILTAKLPIQGDPFKNVDETALTGRSAELINGYTDESGSTVKRPGLASWFDLGTGKPVEGAYWSERLSKLFVVSDGRIWAVTASDGTRSELTTTGDKLRDYSQTGGIGKVSFADDGTYIFMANGGNIAYTNGTNQTDHVDDVDADAPTAVDNVVFHDGYLLANVRGSGQFQWSSPTNRLSWSATDYATAESDSDELVFLGSAWRELLLLGEKTVEVWYNDGSTPFARLEGAFTEGGTESPNSVALIGEGAWAWLDNRRRLVVLSGRITKHVSTPFDKYIQGFSAVSDANASIIEIAGRKFYVLSFPTENKTLVWDFTKMDPTQGWAEWGLWSGSSYDRYSGGVHSYARGWNFNVVGSRSSGDVFKMDTAEHSDNGTAIRTSRRTGHVTHGTNAIKKSIALRIRVKRGEGNAYVTEPVIKIRWNDDNNGFGSWSSYSLGESTDDEMIIKIHRLGTYRSRQWEFVQDERCGFVLIDAEEDFEVLRR